jgi:5-methylcytosine-specific restriction endonuclease McrA
MIQAHESVDLDALTLVGFLVDYDENISKGKREDWDSRYISPDIRTRVLERSFYKCIQCSSTEFLEIDHIVPISKGGTSTEENLQVLCRVCNRKKWNKEETDIA